MAKLLEIITDFNYYDFDYLTKHWIISDEDKYLARQYFEDNKSSILPDLTPLEYDPNINQASLSGLNKFSWFSQVEMSLLSYEQFDKDIWLESVLNKIKQEATYICPIKKKPVISFDLETTGLSTNYQVYEDDTGKITLIPDTLIVGVVIGVSDTKGYYIPVMHTDTERNVGYTTIRQLISILQRDFVNVAHNATYDLGICSSNGIYLNKDNNWDTLLFFRTARPDLNTHSLKSLSNVLLQRPQLEITDILRVSKKDHIAFNRLDSRNAMVYAVPDALNTFALFRLFCEHPYYKQISPFQNLENLKSVKILEMEAKQIVNTISMQETGIPIDKKSLYMNMVYSIHTTSKLHSYFLDKYSLDINKDEKTAIYVGEYLSSLAMSKGFDQSQIPVWLEENFSITIREQTLVSGNVKKIYSLGSDQISKIKQNLPSMFPEEKELVEDISKISEYRSLIKNRENLVSFWVNKREDSRGCFIPVALRLNGTKTKRYANSGLPLPRLSLTFTPKTRQMKIKYTNKQCSPNFQGYPTTSSSIIDSEKYDKVLEEIKQNEDNILNELYKITQGI